MINNNHFMTKNTKLYSPGDKCNRQRWWSLSSVTPTPLLFLHAPCVLDQIRPLISRGRTVKGREGGSEEFVRKGEKDKIRTHRNFIKVLDRSSKGSSSPGRDSCYSCNPTPVASHLTAIVTYYLIDIKHLRDRNWD